MPFEKCTCDQLVCVLRSNDVMNEEIDKNPLFLMLTIIANRVRRWKFEWWRGRVLGIVLWILVEITWWDIERAKGSEYPSEKPKCTDKTAGQPQITRECPVDFSEHVSIGEHTSAYPEVYLIVQYLGPQVVMMKNSRVFKNFWTRLCVTSNDLGSNSLRRE